MKRTPLFCALVLATSAGMAWANPTNTTTTTAGTQDAAATADALNNAASANEDSLALTLTGSLSDNNLSNSSDNSQTGSYNLDESANNSENADVTVNSVFNTDGSYNDSGNADVTATNMLNVDESWNNSGNADVSVVSSAVVDESVNNSGNADVSLVSSDVVDESFTNSGNTSETVQNSLNYTTEISNSGNVDTTNSFNTEIDMALAINAAALEATVSDNQVMLGGGDPGTMYDSANSIAGSGIGLQGITGIAQNGAANSQVQQNVSVQSELNLGGAGGTSM